MGYGVKIRRLGKAWLEDGNCFGNVKCKDCAIAVQIATGGSEVSEVM